MRSHVLVSSARPMKIGIDAGGVIFRNDDGETDTSQTENLVPGVIEFIQSLKARGHTVHLVSFCGKSRERETADAIARLGIPLDFQHYVRDRQLKGRVIRREGIACMIDDRLDVLQCIRKECGPTVKLVLFTGGGGKAGHNIPRFICRCDTWAQCLSELL